MNQTTDMVQFAKAYLMLATSKGETPNQDRMEIYFHDLSDFPLETVLDAMEWARRNMRYFPEIADLRIQIEGSDEDHANSAWDALIRLLYGGPTSTVVLYDVVMAKTILSSWQDWPSTCRAFARISDEFSKTAAKKAFKLSYIEHYKNRDRLRRELECPATLLGGPHPNEKTLVKYELLEYTVDRDYVVTITDRRTVQSYIDPAWGPMPEAMKEEFEARLKRFGKGERSGDSGLRRAPSVFAKDNPPSTIVHSRLLRNDTGDVDVERVHKFVQQRRANAEADRLRDDRAERDAADRDSDRLACGHPSEPNEGPSERRDESPSGHAATANSVVHFGFASSMCCQRSPRPRVA